MSARSGLVGKNPPGPIWCHFKQFSLLHQLGVRDAGIVAEVLVAEVLHVHELYGLDDEDREDPQSFMDSTAASISPSLRRWTIRFDYRHLPGHPPQRSVLPCL